MSLYKKRAKLSRCKGLALAAGEEGARSLRICLWGGEEDCPIAKPPLLQSCVFEEKRKSLRSSRLRRNQKDFGAEEEKAKIVKAAPKRKREKKRRVHGELLAPHHPFGRARSRMAQS